MPLPASPGLVPLAPCAVCGLDACDHEREAPAVPDALARVGYTVPADGVMREFLLDEVP